ncbi:MAG TPA: hypothetical protein VGF28_25725 [Thermoanaerobaculia bacterium]|jgi:hypothetical protein
MTHREKFAVARRAFFSLLLVMLAVTAGAGDVPDVISDEDGPLWVAADVAVTPEGQLRGSALGRFGESVERDARVASARERARSTPRRAEDCETYFGVVPEHFEPTSSFDDLTSHAQSIFSGRVVAVREGFFGGLPGSLLRIEASYLKGSAPLETYLFYPFARIATAGAPLCANPLGAFVPPQRGDRLLIFSMTKGRITNGRRVFQVRTDRELVHEHRGGVLLPDALVPHAGDHRKFDVLLQAVTHRLSNDAVPVVKQ